MHTYSRIHYIHTYTRRTCRPPPRRKLPFAVNLIRVLPPPPPPHCPSYERVTDARWPFRLCTHNFIPPGRRTVVWRRIRRRRVGWLAADLFVYVVLCVAFTFPAKRAFQKTFSTTTVAAPAPKPRWYLCVCALHGSRNPEQIASRFSYSRYNTWFSKIANISQISICVLDKL